MSAGGVRSGVTKVANRFGVLQELVGDVRVVVMGLGIDEAEFDAHVREASTLAASVRVVLMVAEGSSNLTTGQRAKLRHAGLYRAPLAVLTDSASARSIMTAIRCMGGSVAPFESDRLDHACDDLAIPAALRPEIRARIAVMREQVRGGEESPPNTATSERS